MNFNVTTKETLGNFISMMRLCVVYWLWLIVNSINDLLSCYVCLFSLLTLADYKDHQFLYSYSVSKVSMQDMVGIVCVFQPFCFKKNYAFDGIISS